MHLNRNLSNLITVTPHSEQYRCFLLADPCTVGIATQRLSGLRIAKQLIIREPSYPRLTCKYGTLSLNVDDFMTRQPQLFRCASLSICFLCKFKLVACSVTL